jgi:predicted transposase/invertase (TIGR01784 family)
MQPSVHDAFFKSMLSQAEQAASLLHQILPASITARLDLPALTLCSGSVVDEALKERQSDLLFSTTLTGRPALIYLLFEHQSRTDPRMTFRLLRYMVRIWERWQEENPAAARLPIILPVVLHHSASGWTGSTAFEDLLDADAPTLAAMADHVPRFRFVLEDISHESDEALRARAVTALVKLSLWCLRHAREPEELVERLGQWADLVREVRQAQGAAALVKIMRYILATNEPAKPEHLVIKLIAAVGEEDKEEIVTAADQLIERGRAQGREQERREILLDQLRARFGALSDEVVGRVKNADMGTLRVWSLKVLTAPALADVLVAE